MVRVYLDWNVFSYLKNFKSVKEPYISLNRILMNNRDRILMPYSSAHLSDLIPAYKNSEKGKLKTESDLSYLAELTDHLCILYDYSKKSTYPDKYNINDYFQQLLESEEMVSGDTIDSLFSSIEDDDMQSLSSIFLNFLKILPVNLGSFNSEETMETNPILAAHLENFFKGNSFYDLINNTYNFMSGFNTDPTKYRSIRNSSLEQLKLNHDYSQSENPIQDISNNIKLSAFQKSFKEFADSNLKSYFKDKTPCRFEVFTNYYIQLDFFGYYRDKVFKNMIQDSFHAYYGAHCDFFVTDDDNTYHKAKVIFGYLNIKTIVCKSHEFISEFYSRLIINSEEQKPLLKIISEILRTSFVLTNQHDDKFNPVNIYKIDHYVLNYFNRLQVTEQTDSTHLYLYKNNKNYSNFDFYKEIEMVTNKVTLEFGTDLDARSVYMPDMENKELNDEDWKGRHWKIDNADINLNMKESPFGLTLSINLS